MMPEYRPLKRKPLNLWECFFPFEKIRPGKATHDEVEELSKQVHKLFLKTQYFRGPHSQSVLKRNYKKIEKFCKKNLSKIEHYCWYDPDHYCVLASKYELLHFISEMRYKALKRLYDKILQDQKKKALTLRSGDDLRIFQNYVKFIESGKVSK